MNFSKYPIVKILIPYVIGVMVAYKYQCTGRICFFCVALSLFFVLFSFIFLRFKSYKLQWIKTTMLFCAFFFAGVGIGNIQNTLRFSEKQSKSVQSDSSFVVRVIDFPVVSEKSVKLQAELLESGGRVPLKGKVLVYIARDSLSEQLEYGDVLLLSIRWNRVSAPQNPDAFDYQKFMQRKGIFYSGYVSANGWERLDNRVPNVVKAFSKQVQSQLTQRFALAGMTGREQNIIQAILLGDNETMESDLRVAYASAGVSHILCVSGMHVGIIYMILNFLLKPLDYLQRTRYVKTLILLAMIWLYASITGLSPSVTRSATMFTFVAVGKLIQRNTNVFHSLLASLFILLLIHPMLLFDVGFQLSYLAVFGIVLCQPIIVNLYSCKTKIGSYFWELTAVSISAQIITFPISIYYFGQFPNYFLISNLLVMALSFVIIVTGVVLLVVSFFSWISQVVSFVLTWEIRTMNYIVCFVEDLPGSVTQDIDYSSLQVFLLYAFILMLYLSYQYKHRMMRWAAFLVFTIFSVTFACRKVELLRREEMIVYQINKVSALGFCRGQSCLLLSDSIDSKERGAFSYSIKNHARKLHAQWTFYSIDTAYLKNDILLKKGNFIQYKDQSIYLLKRKEKLYPVKSKPIVDWLVVQQNATLLPEQVQDALQFKAVVLEGTCSDYCKQRWRKYCRREGIVFRESLYWRNGCK